MPPSKAFVNDEEVAALVTYLRDAWGNNASAVTPQQVAQVRQATADRTSPWTEAELMQKENQGVPGTLSSLFAPPDSSQN